MWSGLCCGSGCECVNQKHTQSMILTRHQVNSNQLELWIITKNTNYSVNITFTDHNTNYNVRLWECLTETANKSNYARTTCILIQVQNQSGETHLLVPLNTRQRKSILCLTFFLYNRYVANVTHSSTALDKNLKNAVCSLCSWHKWPWNKVKVIQPGTTGP